MWDRWLQGVQAIAQRQQCVPSERDDHRLLSLCKNGGTRLLRSGLAILDRLALPPFDHRLRVDTQPSTQRRGRSLRLSAIAGNRLPANGSLYRCSDGVRPFRASCRCPAGHWDRGAAMTNLSHNASFHSNALITQSNRGIKHLGGVDKRASRHLLIVIQAGICDGDQLGTRHDVRMSRARKRSGGSFSRRMSGHSLNGSSCLSAPRTGANPPTTALFLMAFSGLPERAHRGETFRRNSGNGRVSIGSFGAGHSQDCGNRSWRR